jgi:hypothetical protein
MIRRILDSHHFISWQHSPNVRPPFPSGRRLFIFIKQLQNPAFLSNVKQLLWNLLKISYMHYGRGNQTG